MLQNIDDTIKWIRANDLQYFEVRSREQDNSLIFVTNENDSQETSIARFRDIMNLSQGGRYFIYGTPKGEKSKKGNFREEFSSLQANQPYGISGAASVSTAIPEGFISRNEMEQKIELLKKDMEIRDLKRELSTKKDSMEVFMDRLEPYAPALLGLLTKQPIPAAIGRLDVLQDEPPQVYPPAQPHIAEPVEECLTDEQEERLNNALTKWSNADGDFLELIEKIAGMAASGDSMYTMAKNMLLNK